jgi:uncharacterized protein
VFAEAPPGPWMYTGALENHRGLVRQLEGLRPLWGVSALLLPRVRQPRVVTASLRAAGVPCPQMRPRASRLLKRQRWLINPLAGAGGRGIRPWTGQPTTSARVYLQEFIEGEPCAAVYLGDGRQARLLGVTRQLIGEPWLHAGPFHYCGSVDPVGLDAPLRSAFERLGAALAEGFRLRGLFGVDCVVRDGTPYPVEVNPRYTASVEVLEHATGLALLALHRRAFDPAAPEPRARLAPPGVVGKAVYFAPKALTFPAEGPWTEALRRRGDVWELPAFADVPHPGTPIKAGRPVLTLFARAASIPDCLHALRRAASDMDYLLA